MTEAEEPSNGISVSGWGAALEAHGHWVSAAVLFVGMMVGFVVIRDEQMKLAMSSADYFLEIRRNQDENAKKFEELIAETKLQSWLMSMPFEERPAIVLPPELQQRIDRENKATQDLLSKRRKRLVP